MSELECMVLGTIVANQTLIMNYLDKGSGVFKVGLETSDLILDSLKKLINEESGS